MQWDMNLVSAGFSNDRPWLPTPAYGVDVASQRADPDSLLNLYRRLLQLRHAHPCLRSDDYEDVEAGPDVYAYRRTCGNTKLMVLLNFADARRPVAVSRDWTAATLILSTHRRELNSVVDRQELVLAPNEAVIVELKAKELYRTWSTEVERTFHLEEDFLRNNRFFVTCQTSDDIPWLLLDIKSSEGSGQFTQAKAIQRILTLGGTAPPGGCDEANANKESRVPYTATYLFLK